MAKLFLTPIDLNGNELQNAVIQNLASAPFPNGTANNTGRIYYDTTLNKLGYYDGAVWIYSDITDVNPTLPIVATVNASGVISISINAATTGAAGSMSAADKLKLDNAAVLATINTLVLRDAAGRTQMVDPIAAADVATKNYVDNAVTGAMSFKGVIDASTNPNYPAATAGDVYVVSVTGKIGGASGLDVQVGDMVLASATNAGGDQATVGSSWTILENNNEQATETILGLIKVATQVLADAGADDTTAITPLKLATYITNNGITKKYEETGVSIGATPGAQVITHNLNSKHVNVSVCDTTTNEEYFLDVVHTSVNSITITAAGATKSVYVTVIG